MIGRSLEWKILFFLITIILFASFDAFASTSVDVNVGFYDDILEKFQKAAKGWQKVIENAATFLFWTLGTISLVFTFGYMALRQADMSEFFSEFIRFSIFFGFIYY